MSKLLLPLNIQLFSEDISDQSNAETTQEAPEVKPEKTFTQTELDEIIAKRIARIEKKYEGFEEIKTKASEYEAQLEAKRLAELTEVEKAQEIAKKYEEQLAELNGKLEAERTKAQQQAIKTEFVKFATSANIIDIDAAIALSDLSAVSIDENGSVIGVDELINALVQNKPYLVAKKQSTQPIGQATNGGAAQLVDKSSEQLLAEAEAKAKKSGRIEDKVAYVKLKKQLGK